jgi:hypothetical protein
MSALRITLSQKELNRLKKRATAFGYKDVGSYARSVLKNQLTSDEDFGAPEHLKIRSASDLDAKLLEGELSGRATEMTTADWDRIRTKVRSRATRAKAS